jgi:hypothetical protein
VLGSLLPRNGSSSCVSSRGVAAAGPAAVLGGLRPRNGSSSCVSSRGVAAADTGAVPPSWGYIDLGRRAGSSTAVFTPALLGGAESAAGSAERDRKYPGRFCRVFSIVRGGNRLSRLPAALLSSSSCFASMRLCAAKASRGESCGGISPARRVRGDGRPPRGDGAPFPPREP